MRRGEDEQECFGRWSPAAGRRIARELVLWVLHIVSLGLGSGYCADAIPVAGRRLIPARARPGTGICTWEDAVLEERYRGAAAGIGLELGISNGNEGAWRVTLDMTGAGHPA